MKLEELRLMLRAVLEDSEFKGKGWFAGGCVRDWLSSPLAELSGDVDFTVELPEGGIRMARHLANQLNGTLGKCHPEYGTASLKLKGLTLEFAATRKEQYRRNSRYPLVSFGSLQDDVLRRDFTINSLLMPISPGAIVDLTGMGISDLNKGIIRSLGDAELKFREDPLRMLRALRFALRLGFQIEPHTLQALASQASQLRHLSKKQIRLELEKMEDAATEEMIMQWFEKLGWNQVLDRR